MPTRPRILLDVDGVLTGGFTARMCAVLSDLLGCYVNPDEVDQWDICKCFKVPQAIEDKAYEIMRQPGVCASFQPDPGSQQFVEELHSWAEVYAVTWPLPGSVYWQSEREEWLLRGYGMPRRRVANLADKFIISGAAIVEDKLSNLIDWSIHNPHSLPVFWRIPPNRNDKWNGPQASSYTELRDILQVLVR